MKRQWVIAVMMAMLALVIAGPASAQVICKAQARLCPPVTATGGGCTATSASGVAEEKFQIAVVQNNLLKIKGLNAANQFDADIQGLKPNNAYTLTASNTSGGTVALVVFGTNGLGQADVDVKGLPGQSVCTINTVSVTQFADTTATVLLKGTFGRQDEVQAEAEMEAEMEQEAEQELNNAIENELQREAAEAAQLELQPNNTP